MLYLNSMPNTDITSTTRPAGPRPIVTVPLVAAAGVLLLRPVLLAIAAAVVGAAGIGTLYMNAAMVVVDIVTIGVIVGVLGRQGGRLRDLFGPIRGAQEIGWSLLTTVVLIVGFYAATFIGNLVVYQGPPPVTSGPMPSVPLWLGLLSLLVMPVTVAFAEEFAYRGIGQWSISKVTGPVVGLLIVAFVFGLQHVPLSLSSPQAALARFITTFLSGLIFGAIVLWQKRLVPIIVAHWVLDVLGLGLPVLAMALQ